MTKNIADNFADIKSAMNRGFQGRAEKASTAQAERVSHMAQSACDNHYVFMLKAYGVRSKTWEESDDNERSRWRSIVMAGDCEGQV